MAKLLFVILAHSDEFSLTHLVNNTRFYCPNSTIVLYNSGDDPNLGKSLDLEHFPTPRKLEYAKVVRFFFDVFEWLHYSKYEFDYFINLETDMLFIRRGYEAFVHQHSSMYDYIGPDYELHVPNQSRWRPFRSLKPEFQAWFEFLGFNYFNRAFSPGQIFSKRYISTLVSHPSYLKLIKLIEQNRSFTLQEVLLPTLPDYLNLQASSYPKELKWINRYRPYQAVSGIKRALATENAFFVHPVYRSIDNPARLFVQQLERQKMPS